MCVLTLFTPSYSDTVVVGVPDHLVLNLLPAFEGFVHQDLRGVCEGRRNQRNEFFSVVSEARAQTAERERRTDQDGVSQTFSSRQRLQEK